jgi:hypothetical protein
MSASSESQATVVPGTPLDDKIQVGQKRGEWSVVSYAGKVRYTREGRLVSVTDVWVLECVCGIRKTNTRGNILTKMNPTSHCASCEGKKRSRGDAQRSPRRATRNGGSSNRGTCGPPSSFSANGWNRNLTIGNGLPSWT